MSEQSKVRPLSLRVHSRVQVESVIIRASYSRSQRYSLLKNLGATGTVIEFDPIWTLPWRLALDNGEYVAFARNSLEVLEP